MPEVYQWFLGEPKNKGGMIHKVCGEVFMSRLLYAVSLGVFFPLLVFGNLLFVSVVWCRPKFWKYEALNSSVAPFQRAEVYGNMEHSLKCWIPDSHTLKRSL